jgi:hypothetical protein
MPLNQGQILHNRYRIAKLLGRAALERSIKPGHLTDKSKPT